MMLSNQTGRNYDVLLDGSRFPMRLNKKRTDVALKKIGEAADTIRKVMSDLYESDDYDLFRFCNLVFQGTPVDFEDGDGWEFRYIVDNVAELQKQLAEHRDDVPKADDLLELEDEGFVAHYQRCFWERLISDDGDCEVTEEVFLSSDGDDKRKIHHRIRTIVYNYPSEGVRSSSSITYRNVPVTKKLRTMVANSMKHCRSEMPW